MSKPELSPGQKVLYVPSFDHWHETDAKGEPLFHFVHVEDGPPHPASSGRTRAKTGDAVSGKFGLHDQAHATTELGKAESCTDGVIRTSKNHVIRVAGAVKPWQGTIREEVTHVPRETVGVVDGKEQPVIVFDEQREFVLDVKHPGKPWETLHLPIRTLTYDPAGKVLHSYHLIGEGV